MEEARGGGSKPDRGHLRFRDWGAKSEWVDRKRKTILNYMLFTTGN